MKYQSELIKEIIDRRGHEKSSLHYESECIETWIEENKGSYPKLTDYQAEWLNYINENPIGKFPYLALTDVTNATIDNVVPLGYKSAILKGNTKEITGKNIYTGIDEDGYISLSSGFQTATGPKTTEWLPCEPNTTYVCNSPSRNRWLLKSSTGVETAVGGITGNETPTVTTLSDTAYLRCYYKHDGHNGEINLQIEKGDISTDYEPYWKKLESVKMPVLTTTGKNLIDNISWERGRFDNNTGLESTDNSFMRYQKFIPVKPSTTYVLSNGRSDYKAIYEYDTQKTFIRLYGNTSFQEHSIKLTTSSTTKYIRVWVRTDTISPIFRLEEGSQATSYEPYKSNILTVNEEVELRGIGDVQDTLDCLTGEIVESIGEVVLNGSESWKTGLWKNQVDSIGFEVKIKNDVNPSVVVKAISDKILYNSSNNFQKDGEYFDMVGAGNGETWIRMRILRSKLSTEDAVGFKNWLSQNNIKILYELSDKPIKTVDLTITNQDGETLNKLKPIEGTMHLSTSGENIRPLFSGEIPVEAITQNLASFIEEE